MKDSAGASTNEHGQESDGRLRGTGLQESYMVRLDTWDRMKGRLLLALVEHAGSIRRAAKALDVPRSTLAAWVRKARVSTRL